MSKIKYTPETHKFLAIDYDGTIIEDGSFPEVGEFKPFAIETMIQMQKVGYKLNIWTCRGTAEQKISIMVALHGAGLNIREIGFNTHFQHFLDRYETRSNKIYADVYIDDKAYGISEINWYDIYRSFIPESLDKTI